MSAGMSRRRIPRPNTKTSPSSDKSSSSQSVNKPQPASGSNPTVSRTTNTTVQVADKNGNDASPNKEVMYDANGLRLDRTPTDDEINWLWDKVRTCLSRQSSAGSETPGSEQDRLNATTNRQTAPMAQKFFDGNSLAPKFRTATRLGTVNNYNTSGYMNSNRKKISMNHLNSYNKKNNAANQQRSVRSSQTATVSQTPVTNVTYTSNYNSSNYQPSQSNQGPKISTTNGQESGK